MNTEIAKEGGLDKRQADVAYAMVRSVRPPAEILAEHHVSEEEFTRWVLDGRFTEYAAALARGYAEADAPYIWQALLNTAKEGSIPAIKLYFDIWNKNRGTPQQSFSIPDGLRALREDIFRED